MRVPPFIAGFCKPSPLTWCPNSCSEQVWPVWKCSTRNRLCQAVMLDFIDGLSFTIDVAIDANKICTKNYAIASKCLGFLKHQSSSEDKCKHTCRIADTYQRSLNLSMLRTEWSVCKSSQTKDRIETTNPLKSINLQCIAIHWVKVSWECRWSGCTLSNRML